MKTFLAWPLFLMVLNSSSNAIQGEPKNRVLLVEDNILSDKDFSREFLETSTTDSSIQCDDGQTDYSPCTCYLYGLEKEVVCRNVSMIEVRDGLFSRTVQLSINYLYLYTLDGDSIPEYFFDYDGVRYINYFNIYCDYNPASLLEVSPLAFENNGSATIDRFSSFGCNFNNLDFLKGLGRVNGLYFTGSENINVTLITIPGGFQTRVLGISDSNLLDLTLGEYPQMNGTEELRVTDNSKINDETADFFLNWMLQTSRDSLIKFYMFNNGLKRIPSGLSRFNKLTYFRFDGNILEPGIVKKGALTFTNYNLLAVMLTGCGINTIEAGAFQGVYEVTNVYLDRNNLNRFESDVFQPILEQMANFGGLFEYAGFIEVDENPFDCTEDPCHLSWLLRDNYSIFLPHVWNAACANGTRFEDIRPSDPMFKDCP